MRPVFISGIFSGNFRRQKYFLGDRTCNLQRYLLQMHSECLPRFSEIPKVSSTVSKVRTACIHKK